MSFGLMCPNVILCSAGLNEPLEGATWSCAIMEQTEAVDHVSDWRNLIGSLACEEMVAQFKLQDFIYHN